MKQDVEFNLWVLISSILQALAGVVYICAGATLSLFGLINADKVLKIKEINFWVNQDGISNLQQELFGGILLKKYLLLFIGIIIVVVGMIALALAIVELFYVKRYNVVNHRAALMMFSLIPLALAGVVEAYLLFEYDMLKLTMDYVKNIRIACFAICGVFSACAILKLLGVLLSQSEEFESNNDNGYVLENPKQGKVAQKAQLAQNMPARTQAAINPSQPVSRGNAQNANARPQQGAQPRPANMAQSSNGTARPNAIRSGVGSQPTKPVSRQGVAQPLRGNTLPSRPVQNSISPRQMGVPSNQAGRAQSTQVRRCPKCGKILMPNERVCNLCSKNVNK